MATKYCDHGAYGTYAAVPTWGVAQDGNGKAKTTGDPATASIVFTGTPSGSISVCGVSVSPSWGSGADAAANGLATAINAATGNVTTTGFRSGAVQLRNAVYARGPSAGAPAGTCQVMTRHASADFAGQVCIAHTLTNVDAGSSSLSFTGGTDGCWGYFLYCTAGAATTLWPSGVSEGYYGVLSAAAPYAGSIDAGDVVKVRSNKTLTYNSAANGTGNIVSSSLVNGTQASPIRLHFDDSTEWDDGANPVFRIQMLRTYLRSFLSATNSDINSAFILQAQKYNETEYGFVIEDNVSSSYGFSINARKYCELIGCSFQVANTEFKFELAGDMGATGAMHFRECQFKWTYNSAMLYLPSLYRGFTYFFNECTFSRTGTASAYGGLIQPAVYAEQGFAIIYAESCKFVDFVPGSRLYVYSASDATKSRSLYARNCDFGNVSVCGPDVAVWGGTPTPTKISAASSQYGSRDFFLDTMFGFVEWNSSRSFPYCNAKLLDGTTGWSIHVVPTTASDRNSRFQFAETPRIGKINSLADGARTLTIELAIHDSLSWNKSHISAVIDYIDTDGNRQVVDTYDYDAGALDTSTATWNQEVGGQVTYVDGSTQYHDKYKFSVTTPTSIATGTEIGIVIRCHTYVADTTKGFFIDPEIQVV